MNFSPPPLRATGEGCSDRCGTHRGQAAEDGAGGKARSGWKSYHS